MEIIMKKTKIMVVLMLMASIVLTCIASVNVSAKTNEGKKDISKFTIEWELRQLDENGEYVEAYEFEWLGEGHHVKPSMIVWAENEGVLVKDYDYSCKFINNDRPGVATVIVKGKNDYHGELRRDFKIVDKRPNEDSEESTISLKTDMLLVDSFLMHKNQPIDKRTFRSDFGFWATYRAYDHKKGIVDASNGKIYKESKMNERFEKTLSNLKKGLLKKVPDGANVSFKSSDSRVFEVRKSKGVWKGKLGKKYGICDLNAYDGTSKIGTVRVIYCPKELKDESTDGYKLKVKRKGNKVYFKPYLSKWVTNPKHKITWQEMYTDKKIKDGESFLAKSKKGKIQIPEFDGALDPKIWYAKDYRIYIEGIVRHQYRYDESGKFRSKNIKKIPTKWVTMTPKLYRKIK